MWEYLSVREVKVISRWYFRRRVEGEDIGLGEMYEGGARLRRKSSVGAITGVYRYESSRG